MISCLSEYSMKRFYNLVAWPQGNKTFFVLDSSEHEISQMLIKTKMLKNKDFSCFPTLRCCIYHANKC